MENKKPDKGHSTGFHGNQYVDSRGRRRSAVIGGSANKTGGKSKTGSGGGKSK